MVSVSTFEIVGLSILGFFGAVMLLIGAETLGIIRIFSKLFRVTSEYKPSKTYLRALESVDIESVEVKDRNKKNLIGFYIQDVEEMNDTM